MSKPVKKKVTKDDSEVVVGEDQYGVDIVECPEFKGGRCLRADRLDSNANGKYWYVCPECGNTCWREVNGKTYYHKLSCPQSNGIGYNDERVEGVAERLKANTSIKTG